MYGYGFPTGASSCASSPLPRGELDAILAQSLWVCWESKDKAKVQSWSATCSAGARGKHGESVTDQ